MEKNIDKLIELARLSLNITWEMTDDERDILRTEVEDAAIMLDTYVGGKQDYTKPGLARRTFLACVRYIHNDSTELFTNNFMNDLNDLRFKVATDSLGEE